MKERDMVFLPDQRIEQAQMDRCHAAFGFPTVNKLRNIGMVRPVAKTTSIAVQQVDQRKPLAGGDARREYHSVWHFTVECNAVESDVPQGHLRSQTRMICWRFLSFLATHRQQGEKQYESNKTSYAGWVHREAIL